MLSGYLGILDQGGEMSASLSWGREQTEKPKPGSDHQEAFKGWLSESMPSMGFTSLPSLSGRPPGLTRNSDVTKWTWPG